MAINIEQLRRSKTTK